MTRWQTNSSVKILGLSVGSSLGIAVGILGLAAFSTIASAQQAPKAYGGGPSAAGGDGESGGRTSGGGYRNFLVSMPLSVTRETVGHFEFNLGGRASIAIEAMGNGPQQDVSDQDQKWTGESLVSQGMGADVMVSRYTQPGRLAGFYWGLGLGYRQQQAKWRVKPASDDQDVNTSLVDDTNRLDHDATLSGATGHFRAGYRYVGVDAPVLIGAYVGARHFQAGVRDAKTIQKDDANDGIQYVPMTEAEKERLKRRYETQPEIGIEFGFAI